MYHSPWRFGPQKHKIDLSNSVIGFPGAPWSGAGDTTENHRLLTTICGYLYGVLVAEGVTVGVRVSVGVGVGEGGGVKIGNEMVL
jgi:hypothetical protein